MGSKQPLINAGWVDGFSQSGRHSILISHLVFWFGLGSVLLAAWLPPLRYLYLLTPFLVVMALIAEGRVGMIEEARFYVFFILGGLVLAPLGNKEGLRDLFLAFAGMSVAFLPTVPRVSLWAVVSLVFVATMAFFLMFGHISDMRYFNFMASESALESSSAFYMGAFCVFALYRRQWFLYLFCLLCTVVFLKRIAMLGALAVGVVWLIGEKRSRYLLHPVTMVVANLAIVLVTIAYSLGAFDYYIMHWTHYSANALGQGRQTFLRVPSAEIVDDWIRFVFVGKGPGSAYELTRSVEIGDGEGKTNLHSDLMKIFYEYGFVWYVFLIAVLYSIKSFRAKMLAVFINVLFVTDNSLIYYNLIFFMMAMSKTDPVSPSRKAA